MVALMALSNSGGQMLLTTGNKSEMSVGYATLYGDMAGGYSVLKDAYKTTVFALSRWRNANKPEGALGPDGPVMPERVITKPPTAELRPGPEGRGQPAALFGARPHPRGAGRQGNVGEARSRNATGEDVALVADIESQAAQRRIQAPPGAAGGQDRQPQFRPRPPLPDQQFLPHRPADEAAAMSVVTRFAPSPTGPAARRQHPHGAAQFPVRAEERRRRSCCGSTTPIASARPPSSTRRSATISSGSASSPTTSCASPSGSICTSANSSG